MKLKFIYFIFILLLFSIETHGQCAMCKAAAESDLQNNPNSLAQGLNKGILFLMAIPYVVVATIFRTDILTFFKNLGNKEKNPLNKKRLSNLTFLLTFITCAVLLFILFISFYKSQ
jgi:heme/copper-type cytochrome/quinol oxidase subunit 2